MRSSVKRSAQVELGEVRLWDGHVGVVWRGKDSAEEREDVVNIALTSGIGEAQTRLQHVSSARLLRHTR
jgi:hypothetical protein